MWGYKITDAASVKANGSIDVIIYRDGAIIATHNLSKIVLDDGTVDKPPVDDVAALDAAIKRYVTAFAAGVEQDEVSVAEDITSITGKIIDVVSTKAEVAEAAVNG